LLFPFCCFAFADNRVADAARREDAFHLGKEVRQKLIGGRECIRSARIIACAVPVVLFNGPLSKTRPYRLNAMRIVKSNQPRSVRLMQSERVVQSMRSLRRRRHALDFELQPIAPFKMMNAPVEGEQKFKRVFVGN
jgi:hypothetical protein